MRDAFDRLLRDSTLVTIAFAIALGWALFQVAEGVSTLISNVLIANPQPLDAYRSVEPLTWEINDRILTLGPLLRGLLEFAVVLGAAMFVRRRRA